MAKVTIVLNDVTVAEGQQLVGMSMGVDNEGAAGDAPITNAMMVALTIRRLWDAGVIVPMSNVVCDDILGERKLKMRKLPAPTAVEAVKPEEAPSEASPPPPAAA